MSLPHYINNIDYELDLFHYKGPRPNQNGKITPFEFVYFLLEKKDSCLISKTSYPNDYFDYLSSLGCTIPQIISPEHKSQDAQNWWGSCTDIELEQTLNSKITSWNWAREHQTGAPWGFIFQDFHDFQQNFPRLIQSIPINDWNKINGFIFKSPYLFSGIGHKIYSIQEISSPEKLSHIIHDPHLKIWHQRYRCMDGKFIFEPQLKIMGECGFININGEYKNENKTSSFFHENISHKKGSYAGGYVGPELMEKMEFYRPSIHLLLEDLKKNQLLQKNHWELGLDIMSYEWGDEIRHYMPLEINFRKTMGHLIHHPPGKISPHEKPPYTQLLILTQIQSKNWPFKNHQEWLERSQNHHFTQEKMAGIIWASPPEHPFLVLLIYAQTKNQLTKELQFIHSFYSSI
jgi:hypothetical protein